jgi:HEPN domain-containing protein
LSTELAKHTDELTDITGWHTRMRYPKPSSKIPSELYSRKNAEDAVRIAGNILQEVDALLLHLKQ